MISSVQTILIVVSVGVHILGLGLVLACLARLQFDNTLSTIATVCGAGASALGFELWLLGYLNAWTTSCWIISSLISAIAGVIALARISVTTALVPAAIVQYCRGKLLKFKCTSSPKSDRFIEAIGLITVIIAIYACTYPSVYGDEIDYHWPAPQLWASAHHWMPSSFRFMNGPCFVELMYVPSALFSNLTSGHMTHLLLWLILVLSASAIGALVETPAALVFASIAACPTITIQAAAMLNDVGTTAFLIATLSTLLSLKYAGNKYYCRQLLLASLIFCGGLSAKQPLAAALMPIIACYLWFGTGTLSWKRKLRHQIVFFAPCIVVVALWLAHTHYLTGLCFDIPVQRVWTSGRPPDAAHPYAGSLGLAGPPSFEKFLVLLSEPFVTWLIGNQEPFGNRTGPVIPIFLPVFLLALRKMQKPQKGWALWVLAFATFDYFAVGLVVLRTRYHLVDWTLWSVLAATGYSQARGLLSGRKRTMLTFVFCICLGFGCIDTWHTFSISKPPTTHIMPHLLWLVK